MCEEETASAAGREIFVLMDEISCRLNEMPGRCFLGIGVAEAVRANYTHTLTHIMSIIY